MRSITDTRRTRFSLLGATLALAALLTLGLSPQRAEACTRTSFSGAKRGCTVTEAMGECIRDAEDAYWHCVQRNRSWFGKARCALMWDIDIGGCIIASPFLQAGRYFRGG